MFGFGCENTFQLTHGSLFQLHPEDERDQLRTCLDEKFISYYKHGARYKARNGISVAIIVRSTVHVHQFRADTGKFVGHNDQISESPGKDDQFCSGIDTDLPINMETANALKMAFRTYIKPKLNCKLL